jgi:hypothetical protein
LPGFLDVVKTIWDIHCPGDAAKCLSGKLKLLRKGLKKWSSSFQVLNGLISNCNTVIMMLDEYEEHRNLHISEYNFWNVVKKRLQELLLWKQDYWKKGVRLVGLNWGMRTHPFFSLNGNDQI